MNQTVREIGEQGLLQRLQRYCPKDVVGDDAAVIDLAAASSLVVTTDMLVDQVHFSDRTTSPEDVGWRAAAANLSDLAAMGASPVGITIALGLHPNVAVDWVERLYQGLSDCLNTYNTPIIGGDICRSSVVTVSITAFGQVSPHRVIRRSAAQPGDAIVVTGYHGGSRGGLELLLHPEKASSLTIDAQQFLKQAHQRPKPRLDVLPHLWQLEGEIRVAGMDSSDGLADAVLQICRASGVGATLEYSLIPVPDALEGLVSPEKALEWALYGGEDFELILCLAPPLAEGLVQRLGNSAAIIGTIHPKETVELIDPQGNFQQTLTLSQGFQHLE